MREANPYGVTKTKTKIDSIFVSTKTLVVLVGIMYSTEINLGLGLHKDRRFPKTKTKIDFRFGFGDAIRNGLSAPSGLNKNREVSDFWVGVPKKNMIRSTLKVLKTSTLNSFDQ